MARAACPGNRRGTTSRRESGDPEQEALLAFTVVDGLISEIDVIADPDRVRGLELAVP